MDGEDLFKAALSLSTAIVKQVRPEHFANATPNVEWNVRDLLDHMIITIARVPETISGSEPEVSPDNEVVDVEEPAMADLELSERWQTLADKAEYSLEECDPDETLDTSNDELSVDAYLELTGADLLVHAWELGKAIGITVNIDKGLAERGMKLDRRRIHSTYMNDCFIAARSMSEQASAQSRLLATFGRDSQWRPTA